MRGKELLVCNNRSRPPSWLGLRSDVSGQVEWRANTDANTVSLEIEHGRWEYRLAKAFARWVQIAPTEMDTQR